MTNELEPDCYVKVRIEGIERTVSWHHSLADVRGKREALSFLAPGTLLWDAVTEALEE